MNEYYEQFQELQEKNTVSLLVKRKLFIPLDRILGRRLYYERSNEIMEGKFE